MKHIISFGAMASLALSSLTLSITASAQSIDYEIDGQQFSGYYSAPEGEVKGQVVVIHDWDGIDEYEKKRVDMLAQQGYAAFAADLYGKGNRPQTLEGKKQEMGKMYDDRALMRARILAGLEQLRQASGQQQAVVMGYCFGGGATLELARSSADDDIIGYATFHGSLATPENQRYHENTAPILVMHGGADSGIPMTDVAALSQELEKANVEYDIEVYSGAPHAFTVFDSDRYQQRADEKSWDAFSDFLDTRFSQQ